MHGDVGEEVIVMAELNTTLNNSREQSIWLNSCVVQVQVERPSRCSAEIAGPGEREGERSCVSNFMLGQDCIITARTVLRSCGSACQCVPFHVHGVFRLGMAGGVSV